MSSAESTVFELRTTISVENMSPEDQNGFSERLEHAVYDATSSYPAVVAFFLKREPDDSEIIVGLRIKKQSARGVENIADALLEESLKAAMDDSTIGTARPMIEESELVLA